MQRGVQRNVNGGQALIERLIQTGPRVRLQVDEGEDVSLHDGVKIWRALPLRAGHQARRDLAFVDAVDRHAQIDQPTPGRDARHVRRTAAILDNLDQRDLKRATVECDGIGHVELHVGRDREGVLGGCQGVLRVRRGRGGEGGRERQRCSQQQGSEANLGDDRRLRR